MWVILHSNTIGLAFTVAMCIAQANFEYRFGLWEAWPLSNTKSKELLIGIKELLIDIKELLIDIKAVKRTGAANIIFALAT